ncbi:S6 family peptidase [Streptobacillus ratti]|uniref:S6 family peptidase n=1 Tax=Streptobacillus ratti TaxID=1720557 RepID=UPI000934B011|nr:S6 family peptidase [Streptobacillus ratti]
MRYEYKVLLILLLTNKIVFSNLARHDMNWEDYEDFAMNRGKYSIGRQGVKVYKKDGTLSGTIEQPMPNFDSVVDTGNFALWGDSQILSGAYHVEPPSKFTFSKRHFRNDVELFEGYKDLSLDQKYEKFSENIDLDYRQQIEKDYTLLRTDRIAFDAYVPEAVTKEQWNKIKQGDLVARVGRGLNRVAEDYRVEKDAENKDHHFAGGLNKIIDRRKYGLDQNVQIGLEKEAKTPLDSGAKKGDSGSPLFWWDEEKKKWFMAGSLSSGDAIDGYGRKQYFLGNVSAYEDFKEKITDKEITTETNVEFNNGKLKVDNEEREFKSKEKVDIVNGSNKTKNQIFNKKDLVVKVEGNTNTHAARLEFKQDTTLEGSGTLKTAGFVVHKNVTLKYSLNFGENNVVRKIGEGKLIINSKGPNYGELNLGGGETELQNTDGVAASVIRLAQGAKLTINRADQLNENNVRFGHRGGTLNLNGESLEFKDIYHMDKDAKIANDKNDKKSTFTFKPSKGKRVFLGSFKGNLDLVYKGAEDKSEWSIRSEDTDIKGDFNIENGHAKIEGDNVIHGSDNTTSENTIIHKDEYRETKFKSANINIKSSSTLSVGRATKVESNINVEENATLEMNLSGEVVERPTPYEGAKTEKEINETIIKGKIDFKGKSNTDTKNVSNYNFKANIENNHSSVIESELKGEINAKKEGSGLLYLKNENNSELKGNIEVSAGKLKIKKAETLGGSKTLIKNNAILEVENGTDLNTILDKINKSSEGTLNLNDNISKIDSKYKDYSKLYLGATKDISINDISSDIGTLNLDANNITMTLKGINNATKLSKVNIGNGINKGTVDIFSEDNKKINAEFSIKKNSTLNFSNDVEVKSIENSGDISLKDKSLKIGEYKSNNGKINIHLTGNNKKLLEIEKADKDVDASLKLEQNLIDKIVDNNEKLDIAKIKEHKLNILNLKDYDSVYRLGVEKGENDTFRLYSTIKGDVINNLSIFNELDLINNINNEFKYRNIIEANYVSYNKIDKNYIKLNNVEYMNKLHSNGVEVNFEKANDMDTFIFSGGFNFKVLGSRLITNIKEKESINQTFVYVGTVPKLGIKYKFFDVNFGLGLNAIVTNNYERKDLLIYLNNSLTVGINPKFKISDDIEIRYLNKVGYRLNSMLNKTIKDSVDNYEVLHKKPISIYYETGLKLEHKYVDFFAKTNLEYNWSSYEISKKGKSIDNSFKDDWRINITTGFEFKPTDKVFLNLELDANVYQKSYGRYIFKLGTGYNW